MKECRITKKKKCKLKVTDDRIFYDFVFSTSPSDSEFDSSESDPTRVGRLSTGKPQLTRLNLKLLLEIIQDDVISPNGQITVLKRDTP